jgi:outer membrane protein assembly factor BamB
VQPVPETASQTDLVESLPYLNWVNIGEEDAGVNSVVLLRRDLAYPGLNLYSSSFSRQAVLMDMEGTEVHAWEGDGEAGWHHVELAADGSLYAIEKDISLAKLDRSSKLLWKRKTRAHHDIAIAEDGTVYLLTREPSTLIVEGDTVPILDDYVEILSPTGELMRKIPISNMLADRIPPNRITALKELAASDRFEAAWNIALRGSVAGPWPEPVGLFDVFHTNSLELLPAGRALISALMLHTVAIVDLEREAVVWSWGPGELEYPHQPTMLPSGNLLIFDNGQVRGYSRVIEIDPAKGSIVWEYDEGPDGSFFSKYRGGNQLLPNGNVLITESDRGRAFAVTRDGEIVWDFYNPDRRDDQRAGMYRLVRLESTPGWLDSETRR